MVKMVSDPNLHIHSTQHCFPMEDYTSKIISESSEVTD